MRQDEVIYTSQKRGFVKGRRYMNARHFAAPANGVTSVIIVGKHQDIIDAYRMQAADVKLTVVDDPSALEALLERRASGKAEPSPQMTAHRKPRAKSAEPAEITLPAREEIASLAFPALRQLAAQFSSDEIGSRPQAEAIIEAERARRAAV